MRKSLTLLLGILLLIFPLLFLGCTGDDGDNGAAGLTTLAKTTPEQPGANCPNGGFLIETGVDDNRNGVLDQVEVDYDEYVCNGTDLAGAANPESCSVCHHDGGSEPTGSDHQAFYKELYRDGFIQVEVTDVTWTGAPDNVVTTTFTMTKNGAPFNCEAADSLGIYFTNYDGTIWDANQTLKPSGSAGSTVTAGDGTTGECVVTATFTAAIPDFTTTGNGLVVVYGRDETQGSLPNSRVALAKYPFASLYEVGEFAIGDYVSAANVAGCEKCHTVPFLKHGYIYGRIGGNTAGADPATEFYTCKACHVDTRNGSHFIWQVLVDDQTLAGELFAAWKAAGSNEDDDLEDFMTDAQKAQYAYKARLMNDVHMSHAMEFAYPQSMANCATCHDEKQAVITAEDNFVVETCKSCHPVSGEGKDKQAPAITEIAPSYVLAHTPPFPTRCNVCHSAAGGAPLFSALHTGYDKQIYAAPDVKYSDEIEVTIDSASIAGNVLSFAFSATGAIGDVDAVDIAPTVLVGLYGWDTKDFYIGPHRRTIDSNRDLEAGGSGSGRITITSPAPGSWTATANLSAWADKIADGTIKRAEIGIIPRLRSASLPSGNDNIVALNAPSVTFSIADNAIVAGYGKDIVRVEGGCNNCHDALATTFHTPDRGGNIVICRMCHVSLDDGGHLEMQSRSITSYAHAIHAFQAFDVHTIDFTNPFEELEYLHHTESHFPTFDARNCEACHTAPTEENPAVKYNVPDQFRSMGGFLSRSRNAVDDVDTDPDNDPDFNMVRNIGRVPAYVIGPAGLACGACHRAMAINEDDAGELASLFSHWRTFGYLIQNNLSSTSPPYPSPADAFVVEVFEAVMELI